MAGVIFETDGDVVTVSPIMGRQQDFQDVAAKLVAAGEVQTVTASRGVALRVTRDTAVAAGVLEEDKPAARSAKKTTTKKDG
ncbi:hypothetical protein ACTQX1_08340 [Collinsella bouchesdurhonensis]